MTSSVLVAGRPMLGVSFGGAWTGSITNAVPQLQSAMNVGGVTGHVIEIVNHFCYPSFTASAFTQPFSQLSGYYSTGGKVIMSLQGFPSGGTVANLLAGVYDSNIAALGAAMAPYSDRMVCRYGWECTGNWGFPWQIPVIGVTNYKAMWAYTIPRLRSAGYSGLFEFNCESTNGYKAVDVAPDPSLYDLAGVDEYAEHGNAARSSDWPYCWTTFELPKFEAIAALAARDGKRIAISETATGFRYGDGIPSPGWMTGDNDYFLTQLANWVQNHDVAYLCFFNNNDYNADGSIKNRFQYWVPATKNSAGPFSPDPLFVNSLKVRQSSLYLPQSLAYLGAAPPPTVVRQANPITSQAFRSTRFL